MFIAVGEKERREGELADLSSGGLHPPFPPNAQSYLHLPKVVVYFLDAGVFFLLALSGESVKH